MDYYILLIRYAGKSEAIKSCTKMLFDGSNPLKFRHKGYRGEEKKWNADFENAKAKNDFYEIKIDRQTVILFEKFLIECTKSDIDLVLVYTPEYIEGQEYVSNRNEVLKIYKKLAIKSKINFLDYSNDDIYLNKDLFYNASHLNKSGAEIFSKKLAHDLKKTMHTKAVIQPMAPEMMWHYGE